MEQTTVRHNNTEAACPSGQRVVLVIRRTRVGFVSTILDKSPWDSTTIFIFFFHFSIQS